MLYLAAFTFLQIALYVAKGADPLSPFPPGIIGEGYSQTCGKRPALIAKFATDFIGRIVDDEDLRKAYQVREFNAKSLSNFFYNYVYESHASVNAPDAPISARIVAEAVANNFHKLTEDSVLRIFAYATGSLLFYRGSLSSSNVGSLSEKYFMSAELSINSIEDPTPKANIRAVSVAFVEFLKSQGLFNPQGTVMVAGLFSSLWYES